MTIKQCPAKYSPEREDISDLEGSMKSLNKKV
jgi:hypothetical protein